MMLKLLNRMMTLSLHPLTQRALSMLSSTLCNAPCNNVTNVGLSSYSSSSTSGASRAESMSGRNSVFHLLQLRAIRECGLPDQVRDSFEEGRGGQSNWRHTVLHMKL